MTKLSTDRTARLLGILLGVAVAVIAIVSWRVPGGERTLGADVRIEALQSGEVGVTPPHPFASTPSLLPGGAVNGDATIRNQTGVPLAVRLHALPSTHDLDRLLAVRVSTGSRTLYQGDLDGLRESGTQPLELEAAASARLHVSATLPKDLKAGFQGRIVDVSLQIDSQHRAR